MAHETVTHVPGLGVTYVPGLYPHDPQPLACEPSAQPLVEVLFNEAVFFGDAPSAAGAHLVCTDGRYVETFSSQSLSELPGFEVFRGQLTPEELSELHQAMLAARIGFAVDCELDLGPSPPSPGQFEESNLVTWYGRAPRRRTFVAQWPATDLPTCSAELQQVLDLLVPRAGFDHVAIDGLPDS